MKQDDLHWLAGVIDKGCAITAIKTSPWLKRAQMTGYTIRVVISSVNKSLIYKIHKLVKMGYISHTKRNDIARLHHDLRKNNSFRDRYSLLFHGKEAVNLLTLIHPFLRTQSRRAEIAICLYKSHRSLRRRNDGAVHRQDVNKINNLVTKLKSKGNRTKI